MKHVTRGYTAPAESGTKVLVTAIRNARQRPDARCDTFLVLIADSSLGFFELGELRGCKKGEEGLFGSCGMFLNFLALDFMIAAENILSSLFPSQEHFNRFKYKYY